MNESEKRISNGVLIELPRDQAKAFFGCRDNESVREFLQTQLAGEGGETSQPFAFAGDWPFIAKCFGDGSLDVGSGDPPLSWCFLGGRPMPSAEGTVVNLLRPDMVSHIATRLSELDTDPWLTERTGSLGIDATTEQIARASRQIQSIQVFCDSAAKNGNAVVFAADIP